MRLDQFLDPLESIEQSRHQRKRVEMLFRFAFPSEHQSVRSMAGMLSLLEPLMILLMGGIVGFVVLAILLPIFEASQGFG